MEFYNYIRFFIVYLVFSMILLNIQLGLSSGTLQTLLIAIFYIAFFIFGYIKKYIRWFDILSYVIPTSFFFLLIDWVSTNQLGVLEFSKNTILSISNVPLYLVGMWTIALFLILYTTIMINQKYKKSYYLYFIIVAVSIFVIVLSDENAWQLEIWKYKDVKLMGHTPVFMLIPNLLLGFQVYFAYQRVRDSSILKKTLAAFITMFFRLILVFISYYAIERLF